MTASSPAYLIASSFMPEGHGSLDDYAKAAHPLFDELGVEVIAMGNVGAFGRADQVVHHLEGEWPQDASLTLFRFPSLDALLKFWSSDEYQSIKHLRTDAIKPNFTIAIDGA